MWFRSWLLLFVLWSSFGHAQYVVDLAQAGPVEVPAGLHIDSVALREEAQTTRARLDALISANPEHESMLHQLESQSDAEPRPDDPAFYMSGEEIAAELEQFLREEGS